MRQPPRDARRTSGRARGAAAFVAGVGGTMWTVNARVIYQTLVPNELLGRFNAASRLVGWGMAPITAGLAGLLAALVNFQIAFGFFAILCVGLIYPYLRVVTTESFAPVDAPDDGEFTLKLPAKRRPCHECFGT